MGQGRHRARTRPGAMAVIVLAAAAGCGVPPVGEFPWSAETVQARMDGLGVPAVSVAVIDGLEIAWAGAYGVLETPDGPPADTDTVFQTASVGKSAAAMSALTQVGLGAFDLDQDVTTYLRTWTLPQGAQSSTNPVTLRRLLSHTAGTTEAGLAGYPRGAPLPTLDQTLAGQPSANSPPVRVEVPPGTGYRYSNLGYQVAQKVLEDTTGVPFADLVTDTVFNPIGMASSRYAPLPSEAQPRAASGHRADGSVVPGQWREYPEHAAAGYWTTPTDLARFGIDLMESWRDGSGAVLSQELAREMLTPVDAIDLDAASTQSPPPRVTYALGLGIGDDGGDRLHAIHTGGNTYAQIGFQSKIVLYPERGQGMVVLTNSDTGDALIDELVASVSRELRWYSGVILDAGDVALLALAALGAVAAVAVVVVARRRRLRSGVGSG